MILNSDLMLNDPLWEKADRELVDQHKLFGRLVDIFVIACAIGIRADKSVSNAEIEFPLAQPKSIGRNTYLSMSNSDLNDILNFLLQNAIITSKTIDFEADERLKLAFNPDYENKKFSPAAFLVGFATYGIKQIYKHVNNNLPSEAIADELHTYFESEIDSGYEDLLQGITLEELLESAF